MIFSNDLVIKARNSTRETFNSNNDSSINSFFIESLQTVLEESKKVNAILYEVEDSSKQDIDYKKSIESILDTFIDSINSNYSTLMEQISTIKSNSQGINQNIDCQYSNLGIPITNNNFKTNIDNDYRILIAYLSELGDKTKIYELSNDIETRIANIDDEMNSVRGSIYGSNNPAITVDNYASYLYSIFRSKSSNNELDEKKILLLFKKEKEDLVNAAEQNKSNIESLKLPNEDSDTYRMIMSDYITRIKDLCEIYLQYFAAKEDAIREYITCLYSQNDYNDEEVISNDDNDI